MVVLPSVIKRKSRDARLSGISDFYNRERLPIQREQDVPGEKRRVLGRHYKQFGFHSAFTSSESSAQDIFEFGI